MILSDQDIAAGIADGDIIIDPYDAGNIDADAYEVHLAPTLLKQRNGDIVDARNPDPNQFDTLEIDAEHGFILEPGSFVLGTTLESVGLPNGNIAAELDGRTTLAGIGLMPVLASRHLKPGSSGKQTFEIFNFGVRAVRLTPGLSIAKLIFHRLEHPAQKGYQGPYHDQTDGSVQSKQG